MHLLFFNLLLVFLPTQLGYHFWPAWAMVLGRRVDFLSPTLYVTDILILLILIFWRPKKILSQRLISPWLTIVFFAFVNILFAGNRFVSIYFWIKILEYTLLGFYIVKTKPKFSSMVFFLSIGVLYSSVIAIGQFILQRSIGGPLWFLGERTFTIGTPGIARFFYRQLMLRPYATFPHPNVLGGFLAILVPLMLHEINKRKTLYIITCILGIIALVLTFSRSAWIAAIIGIIFVARKKNFFIPLLILPVATTILVISTLGFQDESVVVRQALNNSAITMFRQSPVIGKGLGNFLVELPNHLMSRQIYFLQPVHNIFLLILSETGIAGFTVFIWLLWRVRKNWIFLLVVFLGFVDHYFLTLQQGQLLLTILLSSTMAL